MAGVCFLMTVVRWTQVQRLGGNQNRFAFMLPAGGLEADHRTQNPAHMWICCKFSISRLLPGSGPDTTNGKLGCDWLPVACCQSESCTDLQHLVGSSGLLDPARCLDSISISSHISVSIHDWVSEWQRCLMKRCHWSAKCNKTDSWSCTSTGCSSK